MALAVLDRRDAARGRDPGSELGASGERAPGHTAEPGVGDDDEVGGVEDGTGDRVGVAPADEDDGDGVAEGSHEVGQLGVRDDLRSAA